MFVVCSADHQIISADICRAAENDTALLKETDIYQRCQKFNFQSFTRKLVDGRQVTIPGHIAFDNQADMDDEIARTCPNFVSSHGKLSGRKERQACGFKRGLAKNVNYWQKSVVEPAFATLQSKYKIFAQLPVGFRDLSTIKFALTAAMTLYNFEKLSEHREEVDPAASLNPTVKVRSLNREFPVRSRCGRKYYHSK